MTNIVFQSDPFVVLVQDPAATATIQTGIVLVGTSGSVSGPREQAVAGNVPQWANNQGTTLESGGWGQPGQPCAASDARY
jgi:hypothetical protein